MKPHVTEKPRYLSFANATPRDPFRARCNRCGEEFFGHVRSTSETRSEVFFRIRKEFAAHDCTSRIAAMTTRPSFLS
jgi:hypothetical protein